MIVTEIGQNLMKGGGIEVAGNGREHVEVFVQVYGGRIAHLPLQQGYGQLVRPALFFEGIGMAV